MGGDAASLAVPAKELVFVDDWFNWRQVPDLMSLGLAVIELELTAASAAVGLAIVRPAQDVACALSVRDASFFLAMHADVRCLAAAMFR